MIHGEGAQRRDHELMDRITRGTASAMLQTARRVAEAAPTRAGWRASAVDAAGDQYRARPRTPSKEDSGPITLQGNQNLRRNYVGSMWRLGILGL